MKRQYIVFSLWFCIILGIGYLLYVKVMESPVEAYTVHDFVSDLDKKGYKTTVKEADKDFLNATRVRVHMKTEVLDVYTFSNTRMMHEESGYIHKDGCGYDNGRDGIKISWVSYPHFFKKGDIIVQYVGEDQGTVELLEEILGNQFAGYGH